MAARIWNAVPILPRLRVRPSELMSNNPAYAAYEMGEGSYGYPRVRSRQEGATLIVGKYCLFANGSTILLGGEHRVDRATPCPFSKLWPEAHHIQGHPRKLGDGVIGNDVWIGLDALILSGVRRDDPVRSHHRRWRRHGRPQVCTAERQGVLHCGRKSSRTPLFPIFQRTCECATCPSMVGLAA